MCDDLLSSRLYDNRNFYKAFVKDLKSARASVLIESPFITVRRMNDLLPKLRKLRKRRVRIVINTRMPVEHDPEYEYQALQAINEMQDLGITVLYTGKHHRKMAIIDNEILWEGSLNILSQYESCEIMRRTDSEVLSRQMLGFIKLGKFL